MGYDKGRPVLHQAVHSRLHDFLCAGIDRARRLIQNKSRRIRNGRAGDGKKLPLALRQVGAVPSKHCIISLRKTPDKTVRVGEPGGTDNLRIRRIQLSVADVLPHCTGKQVGVLQHDSERAAQVAFFDLIYIDVVKTDLTVLYIIKPVDQVGDRGLACAGGADKGNLHAGLCVDPDIMQDHLVIPVSEVDAVEGDIAFQGLIGGRILRLVIVLPRPLSRMPVRLDDLPVCIALTVDQHDIAVVRLGLCVHELENALRAGQGHDDTVELHADLVDRHGETPVQGQETGEGTDCKSGIGIDRQNTAHDRADHIVGVSQLSIDRTDDIGKAIGFCGTLVQLFIELIEFADRLLFMAEHLDDFFAGHGLLNKPVQFTQIPLLGNEISSGHGGYFSG